MSCPLFLSLFLSVSLLQIVCPAYAQEANAPAVGSMNGHRLRIPRNFMLFDVAYEGENLWSGKPRTIAPTLDTPLHNFGMFLRLDTMEPRGASPEEETNFRLSSALDSGDWTIVSVQKLDRPPFSNRGEWLSDIFRRVRNPEYLKVLRYNKFIDDAGKVFDLNHSLATYESTHDVSLGDFAPIHTYWNDEVDNTFIDCRDPRKEDVVKIVRCSQTVYIKELNANATANYTIRHLKHWRFIADSITRHVRSFFQ